MVCRGYGTIWDTTSDMVVLDGWEMTGACIVHGVTKCRQAGRQVSTSNMACIWGWHAAWHGMFMGNCWMEAVQEAEGGEGAEGSRGRKGNGRQMAGDMKGKFRQQQALEGAQVCLKP